MKTLYVKDRRAWRAWLRKNAQTADEIWLVYYKLDSRKPRIPYDHAVEEALCFGWIDSIVKKIDEARYAQRFTPRKPRSVWSPSNILRVEKLIAQKKMTAAGLKLFEDPKRRAAPVMPTRLPKELEDLFKRQSKAWERFNRFPPYYRRMTIGWVAGAKKEETRLRRLNQLIEFSARDERLKFI